MTRHQTRDRHVKTQGDFSDYSEARSAWRLSLLDGGLEFGVAGKYRTRRQFLCLAEIAWIDFQGRLLGEG